MYLGFIEMFCRGGIISTPSVHQGCFLPLLECNPRTPQRRHSEIDPSTMRRVMHQTMKDSPQPHCSSIDSQPVILSQQKAEKNTYIGIPKNKSLVKFILHPIHFTSDDAEKGFAVDEDFDPVQFHCLIKSSWLLHVF